MRGCFAICSLLSELLLRRNISQLLTKLTTLARSKISNLIDKKYTHEKLVENTRGYLTRLQLYGWNAGAVKAGSLQCFSF